MSQKPVGLLLAAVATLLQVGPALPPAEVDARQKLARTWSDFAKWCGDRGQKEEGLRALETALAAGLGEKESSALKAALEKAATKPADPALTTKLAETRAAAAKQHSRLVDLALAAKAPERAESALAAQFELDPGGKEARKDLGALLKEAGERGWNDVAARWLSRARTLDPEAWKSGRYRETQVALGRKDLMLLGGVDHALVACVALPSDWSPAKKELPILVAVEGAGCNFAGCCRLYRDARGARASIVVTPCSLSNTNALDGAKYPWYDAALLAEHREPGEGRVRFDDEGLEALLAELRRDWGGGERVALTGFSGGGILTWWWTLQHPERTALAVGCCANFGGLGVAGASSPPDGGPPIHLFIGEKDEFNLEVFGQKPGLVGQADLLEQSLRRLGYAQIARKIVPGAGHANFPGDVWQLFLPR